MMCEINTEARAPALLYNKYTNGQLTDPGAPSARPTRAPTERAARPHTCRADLGGPPAGRRHRALPAARLAAAGLPDRGGAHL